MPFAPIGSVNKLGSKNFEGFNKIKEQFLNEYAIVSSTSLSASNIFVNTIEGVKYRHYIFKGTGTITFSKNGSISLFAVAGGATGGRRTSSHGVGGGGAGGVFYKPDFFVDNQTYTIQIGAGGAATNGVGNIGGNTTFGSLTVLGGGRGSDQGGSNILPEVMGASSGGSGGGNSSVFTDVVGGFGYYQNVSYFYGKRAGIGSGHGTADFARTGGGGGGAGVVGGNGSPSQAGVGGNGLPFSIVTPEMATIYTLGEIVGGTEVWFGGGSAGGTGSASNSNIRPGGLGGGTATGVLTNPSANALESSGGAAGACNNNTTGSGGSGVLIVSIRV